MKAKKKQPYKIV